MKKDLRIGWPRFKQIVLETGKLLAETVALLLPVLASGQVRPGGAVKSATKKRAAATSTVPRTRATNATSRGR